MCSSILYSTLIALTQFGTFARSVAIDSAGNGYVAGSFQGTDAIGLLLTRAFLVKIDPTKVGAASEILQATLGLNGTSRAEGVAVDPAGNIYLTGTTDSSTFPTTPGVKQPAPPPPTCPGCTRGFVAKLDPTGRTAYATYVAGTGGDAHSNVVGGTGSSFAVGIASDQQCNIYVAGLTSATDFPIVPAPPATPSAFQTTNNASNGGTGFVLKIARKITTTTVNSSLNPHWWAPA